VSYKIVIQSPAQRDINRLPPKVANAVLHFIYYTLAKNPYRVGKSLRWEWEGYYTARRLSYRIVYCINDEQIVVDVVKWVDESTSTISRRKS
jgi:mRNA interferase RelE/StbE